MSGLRFGRNRAKILVQDRGGEQVEILSRLSSCYNHKSDQNEKPSGHTTRGLNLWLDEVKAQKINLHTRLRHAQEGQVQLPRPQGWCEDPL